MREGVWATNPVRWLRSPKLNAGMRVPRRIGKSDMKKLWEAAGTSREEHGRYQTLAMLAVIYGTGLRRGEIVRLDVKDWLREEGILKLDGQKTGSERHVPVGPGVWSCIEAYLPRRQNKLEAFGRLEEEALFLDRAGKRVSNESVSRAIKRLAKRAGVEGTTLHRFRHSCASDLLEAGTSLPEVKEILGHAVIETTMRYTSIADPQRAGAMEKHPINRILAEEMGEES